MAPEEPKISPGIGERNDGGRGENGEPDEQKAPEDLRISDGLEPEQVGEPAERSEPRDQQRDHQPKDPGGGRETQKGCS
jgi:hypothetical protein